MPSPSETAPPPQPKPPLASAAPVVPATLAFVAGFVDVHCYLGLSQTFAAFMTGTLIALGAELAVPTPGASTKAAMIATFVPAVIAAAFGLKLLRRRLGDEAAIRHLLLAEALLLVVMMLLGGVLAPPPGAGGGMSVIVGMAAVVAMSVQNVLMVHLLAYHPATTVMTLNMTRMIGHAVGAMPPHPGPDGAPAPSNAAEARRYAAAIAPFLVGVAAGAVGYLWLGFWSVAVPVAALLLLLRWMVRQPGR